MLPITPDPIVLITGGVPIARDEILLTILPVTPIVAILTVVSITTRQGGRAALTLGLMVAVFLPPIAHAADWTNRHDDGSPAWRVRLDRSQMQVTKQERRTSAAKAGAAGELIELNVVSRTATFAGECAVDPCRWLDEVRVSLWLKATQPGLELQVRVVFPETLDPDTNEPAAVWLSGETCEDSQRWQQLSCRTTEKRLREKIQLYRARTRRDLNISRANIDRVALVGSLSPGPVAIMIDELLIQPHVPTAEELQPLVGSSDEPGAPETELRMDRLMVNGRPLFLRLGLHQGEETAALSQLGLNAVWTHQSQEPALYRELRQAGVWPVATPPRPTLTGGVAMAAHEGGLPSFGAEEAPVLFWMLGARLGADWQDEVRDWVAQVQDADHARGRPIAADVVSHERSYSRQVQLLGLSRHVAHSGVSLRDYQRWLQLRRGVARPGTYCWTWLQTEVSPAIRRLYPADQGPRMVEPELIRLQAYAAAAAGYRGLGYWSTIPLDEPTDEARERALQVALVNQELSLFEPWLAGGSIVAQEYVRLDGPSASASPRGSASNLMGRLSQSTGVGSVTPDQDPRRDALATVYRTELGSLLLVSWLHHGAHYVPGPLTATEATVVVPGADESAAAWLLGPTRVEYLHHRRVSGGLAVTIRNFDQVAAVLLTADHDMLRQIEGRVSENAELAARREADLAELKWQRIKGIQEQLRSRGAQFTPSAHLLEAARQELAAARRSLQKQEYTPCYASAAKALQYLRRLQWTQWEAATQKLSHPTESLYAQCYGTLPQHTDFMARAARSVATSTIELAGDCESVDAMTAAGWRHAQASMREIVAHADVVPGGRSGAGLRLSATWEGAGEAPHLLAEAPVTVTLPAIPVRMGQVVRTTGWVKIPKPLTGSTDGLMVYDQASGKLSGRRFVKASDWQSFRLQREALQDGVFETSIALTGLGEVILDEIDVKVLDEPEDVPLTSPEESKPKPAAGRDLWPKLPSLPAPWTRPKSDR